MKTRTSLLIAFLLLFMGLAVPAAAEVVGRLTQVEGLVDFLKGGKLPAAAAKLDDSVEVGDVLRTKSLSKAQITFMDNTVITLSPESRIAIEEYMFDPGKGKRSAVLQLFQGLAKVVVSKIFKAAEPDFVVKTNTAVMGVRGTEVGIRLGPNDSTFLNFQGLTRVANIFPEVSGDLFRKAAKVSFSFGGGGFVDLQDMQGTVVSYGLPPTLPFGITDQDRQMFNRQLSGVFAQQRAAVGTSGPGGGGGSGSSSGGSFMSGSLGGSTSPGALSLLSTPTTNALAVQPVITPIIISPIVTPSPSPSPISTFNFTETFSAPYSLVSASPYSVGTYTNTGPGSGLRTGVYPGSFTGSFNWVGILTPDTFSSFNTGTITLNSITGTVSGTLGQPLTGTITIQNAATSGGTTFNYTGPVTIYPNGNLSSPNLTGTILLGGQTGQATGTLNQTATTVTTPTVTTLVTTVATPVVTPVATTSATSAVTLTNPLARLTR